MTTKSILITGGAGFIGSQLAASLIPDADIRVLDSFRTGARKKVPDEATLIEGDLRDTDALRRATADVDLVFHEAALVNVQESVEMPRTSHEINVDATLALLERIRELDARIVLASSAAIYGHPAQVPIKECDSKTPTSPYGLEKLTGDHYARLYHELYAIETVTLRYFNVYGPGQIGSDSSSVISIFLEKALNDEPITIYGDGEQTRDFVFIDDVVQANLLAAETDNVGNAYNIGTGTSVTINDLAETIIEITGSNSEIVHIDERNGDIRHSQPDITNAQDQLGYEPTISLREGLQQTITQLGNYNSTSIET